MVETICSCLSYIHAELFRSFMSLFFFSTLFCFSLELFIYFFSFLLLHQVFLISPTLLSLSLFSQTLFDCSSITNSLSLHHSRVSSRPVSVTSSNLSLTSPNLSPSNNPRPLSLLYFSTPKSLVINPSPLPSFEFSLHPSLRLPSTFPAWRSYRLTSQRIVPRILFLSFERLIERVLLGIGRV